jgi:hypothetical protein
MYMHDNQQTQTNLFSHSHEQKKGDKMWEKRNKLKFRVTSQKLYSSILLCPDHSCPQKVLDTWQKSNNNKLVSFLLTKYYIAVRLKHLTDNFAAVSSIRSQSALHLQAARQRILYISAEKKSRLGFWGSYYVS